MMVVELHTLVLYLLTQIPGDPDSVKGNKARGVYWTKPDKSGKEVSRDVTIDESRHILNL